MKGKLGQQAKEEGRQAEAGSREHDAPTARARAGRVGSGVWTLEEGRDLGRSLDREIYSAQCPRPLDPFGSGHFRPVYVLYIGQVAQLIECLLWPAVQ